MVNHKHLNCQYNIIVVKVFSCQLLTPKQIVQTINVTNFTKDIKVIASIV